MGGSTVTRAMRAETSARRIGLLAIALALLTVTGMLVLAKPAEAATSTVPDGDVAALKSAINTANQNAGLDTITLATDGTYNLTEVDNEFFGANGLPAIRSEITIEGNGAKITRSGPDFRLFYVSPSGNLTLRDAELSGGRIWGGHGADSSANAGAGGGAAGMGGAIFNAGTLSVERSTIAGNSAFGGHGGDYNQGNSLDPQGGGGGGVAGPGVLDGGPGNYEQPGGGCWGYSPSSVCYQSGIRGGDHGGNGGPGGGGGAGHNVGEGGFGGFGGGGGGGGYQGGRGGHGGGYSPYESGSPGTNGGTGFGGGGGGGGNMNPSSGGSSGGPGEGGYGGGDGLNGAGGGAAGVGGAIFNHAGTLTITNSTVASNDAVGGFGGTGAGGIPGEDGVGLGGGLFNRNGAVTIQSSTFSNNVASTLRPDRATTMAGGTGGGIYNLGDHQPGVTVTMNDTIVADSIGIPPNGGSISDYAEYGRNGGTNGQGNSNIIESGGGLFSGTVTADPKFDPGQDNGGPAHPYTLGSGSPAIDAAGSDCPATDQRGIIRPQNGDANGASLCDIGAVEVAPPLNDAFANARTVSGNNVSVRSSNLAATREPGEPRHDVDDPDSGFWTGDHSVWFRWTATYSGPATVDTCQTKIDSILAVYTGDSLGNLSRIDDNNNHADCNGSWGSKLTFDAQAGTTYWIAVGDAGGLRQNTFTLKLGLSDTAPPDTTITSGPSGPTNDNTPTFAFTGSDNASAPANLLFSYKVDGGAWSAYSSATSVTLPALANGAHTFSVRDKDAAGNEDQSPAERTFTVDTIKPTISGMSPRHGSITRDTTPTIRATVRDNNPLSKANVKLYVGGRLISATKYSYTPSTGALVYNSPRLSLGKKTIKIVATDAAGNVSTKSWYFTIK